MACNKCRDFNTTSCTDIVPSNCIPWQGVEDEDLEICLNDSLTYVGNILIEKIQDLLKGIGIILEDLVISDCEYIEDLLGVQEKNLLNILNVYKEGICQLKEDLDALTDNVNSFTNLEEYDTECLGIIPTPCDDTPTFKDLIQALIDKYCELNSEIESIATSLLEIVEEGAGNMLIGGAITSCGGNGLTTSGTGASAVVTFEALVPPLCPIVYIGTLDPFDMTGQGLPNTPYCGWFLCNGNNGTPSATSLPQDGGNTIKYIMRFN